MKKSTMWMVMGIVSMVAVVILGVSLLTSAASADEINLEAASKAFEVHAKTGSNSLAGFEKAVNKPSVYTGKEPIKTVMAKDGSVIGYKDRAPVGYQSGTDELVFRIEPDEKKERIIATDSEERRYSHRTPGLYGFFLMGRMTSSQRAYYPKGYRAPTGGFLRSNHYRKNTRSYGKKSGYGSKKSGYGAGKNSVRRSSTGSRRSGSGGFGFGK